ncbi:MAG: phage holin family protein [Bacteroidales bacterium]
MNSNLFIKIFTFVLSYFAPIATIIHVMLIFILIDLISGIWAAKKANIPIESSKMRKTVSKLIWYMVAVIMAHMMENTFAMQWSHMAQICGGFICMVEIKSVFENISKITNEPVFIKLYKLFEKKAKDTVNLSNNQNSDQNESTGSR